MSEISDFEDEFMFDSKMAKRTLVIAEKLPAIKIRKYRWQEMEAM